MIKNEKREKRQTMKQEVTVELAGGKRITFETGRMAKQASGAAFTTSGDNAVLATAVASPDPKEGIDFFPLTVEYRENTYAGGRIPGGFIKREGRPSEKEILTCRQIDRPIRPLFPATFRNETQVVAFVYSADKENDPDVLGMNGASCALALSDIPFHGPVGAVRIGLIDDAFIVNPTYAERAKSLLNIMVVGTKDGIVMVESGSKECSEVQVVDAIEFAHVEIKKICAAIEELVKLAGKTKRVPAAVEIDQVYLDELSSKVGAQLKDALDTAKHPKFESYALVKEIKDALKKALPEGDAEAGRQSPPDGGLAGTHQPDQHDRGRRHVALHGDAGPCRNAAGRRKFAARSSAWRARSPNLTRWLRWRGRRVCRRRVSRTVSRPRWEKASSPICSGCVCSRRPDCWRTSSVR